ncbi:hypothetical protein CRYUN_Cryun01aG0113700 [Craigia yunnanensis]
MEDFSIIIFITFLQFAIFIASEQLPYVPRDNITLNCGATSDSNGLDGWFWTGDKSSKFGPVESSQNKSEAYEADSQGDDAVPYMTARVSSFEFKYSFPVTLGQKFVRLYFHAASYKKFDQSKAFFSVKAGSFTLLKNFSTLLFANSLKDKSFVRELCLNIEENQVLDLIFIPSPSASNNTFAFINGIEIVSMPPNLYYTPPESLEGVRFIGQSFGFYINNYTALEMVYRLNIGGTVHTYGTVYTYEARDVQDDQHDTGNVDTSSTQFTQDRDKLIFSLRDIFTGILLLIVFYPIMLILVSLLTCMVVWRYRKRQYYGSYSGTNWFCWWINPNKGKSTRSSVLLEELCCHFALDEIKVATNNFHDDLVIGKGGFGKVYKGFLNEGEKIVAIKRLNPESRQGITEFLTEIEMLSQLRHVHLVSLIGYCNEKREMILVYDFMSNGTLSDHLYGTSYGPLTWKQRLEICKGAAIGLNYLHTEVKHTVIHRDVKTSNILLDDKFTAKVSNFGLSKMDPKVDMLNTAVKGTWGYLDPEYARGHALTEKSDVYSFGVVLFEVLCARKALDKKLPDAQVSLAH